MPGATRVGTVAALNRFPVKSMLAEPLDVSALHWTGLHGDRAYAFVKAHDRSDFPWLTARALPALVRYAARFTGPDPGRSPVSVRAPDGDELDVRDPALAERLGEQAGQPVWLLRIGRGAFDAMPVSVLTTTAVDSIGQAHGAAVGAGRFRANILVAVDPGAAPEREWLGGELAFGAGPDPARLRLDLPIPRCAMVAIDPDTAATDASVLRTVVQRFGNRVGTYCTVAAPGRLAVGDAVWLLDET